MNGAKSSKGTLPNFSSVKGTGGGVVWWPKGGTLISQEEGCEFNPRYGQKFLSLGTMSDYLL